MLNNLVERNRLRREAEQTNKRQAELLSVLSHDVRAPFQALLGTIELLMKSRIPADAVGKVEDLYRCAKDQLAFINSLLELLRLESATTRLRLSQIDVNLPVGQSVQSLQVLAQAKDICISTDLSTDLPRIQGDIGRIAQLMNNLLSNAIKFTPRRGKISVTTRECSRQGAPGVEIRVEDTGIGMRLDDPNDVFQRFRRGRDQGTEGENGSGLGLAICKQIVQIHDGTIEIGRATRNGTVVSVKLPAWSPPAGKVPHAKRIDTSFHHERTGRQAMERG
jgi:signal transduction histidine kinase